MHHRLLSFLLLIMALSSGLAGSAYAQGYTVEPSTDSVLPVPPTAQKLTLANDGTAASARAVQLPFAWRYYGESYATLVISAHGWMRPGGGATFAQPDDPQAPHGQDVNSGSFPYSAAPGSADGILTPHWSSSTSSRTAIAVSTWTVGVAPKRRFVVNWDRRSTGATSGSNVQVQILEGSDGIQFLDGSNSADSGDAKRVRGLDEPGGRRCVVPSRRLAATGDSANLLFMPRTALRSAPGTGLVGQEVVWKDVRRESTIPDGCTKRCTYLAKGRHHFSAPDRALFVWDAQGQRRKLVGPVTERLQAEDLATFPPQSARGPSARPSKGDAVRWVRQVLDGKVLLVPADATTNGGRPVRVSFRIVEYFSLDERGATGADQHIWNLRWMLSNAFPKDDPRRKIDHYQSWKAMARGRLSVGKLFPVRQSNTGAPLDNSASQFNSGRTREYVLWSGHLRAGGAAAPTKYDAPTKSTWRRFTLEEDDARIIQHERKHDVRFVADPNYVDGGYTYVIRALDNAFGWVVGKAVPSSPLRDETLPAAR